MADLFVVPKAKTREIRRAPSAELSGKPSGELSDADARADALDIQQSWIVEAPAGSGKTGLLIQRYLKLLADASVTEPEQVLAITFTTKATAEMRERVLGHLQAASKRSETKDDFDRATRRLAEAVLLRDRQRNWSLLDQLGRLNIRTIDSVCSQITNALPILSGSGGRLTPVDDAAPLYALAARRTFLKLGGVDLDLHEALRKILLLRDGNLASCEALLAQMLALRDQWGGLVPIGQGELDDAWLDANILPKLERTLDQAICAALTHLEGAIPADVLGQLTIAAADMAHLDGYKGNASPVAVCAGRRNAPGASADDLEHWKALMHLLITPSTKKWRQAFSANVLRFNAGKFEQQQLKQIVSALEGNDQLLFEICKIGRLPPARYPADQWAIAKYLFRILNRAMVELQLVFAERGECDFAEISLAARTALDAGPEQAEAAQFEPVQTEPALEAALGFRLQHLLVDEMQDTSSGQYSLIQALTRNWDGQSQTAFLVGDPKQSIYLFRQARVERFLRTMRTGQLGDLPVGVLRLTANFRSRSELVDDFNADFAAIFPAVSDSLHPEEVPYVAATSARGSIGRDAVPQKAPPQDDLPYNYSLFDNAPEIGLTLAASASTPARIWHANVLPYETDKLTKARNRRAQRAAEAAEICEIVRSWRSRPFSEPRSGLAPPERAGSGTQAGWTIAVLCRSRNHLDEIVAAFKAAAIPFRAVDIDPLKERPEVQDLIALTRALLHPADRVAWLAILRAPWCGLSLAELYTLTGGDLDGPAFAERSVQQIVVERGHLLPENACQRLQRIWPALEAAVASRARMSLAQLVERTWRSLGGDAYLQAAELTNTSRYIQLLNQIEAEVEQAGGAVEIALLERRLDRLYAAPALHANAVDLLTIHKAKGLEWDVVIVPALERAAPVDRGWLLNWVELDSADEESAHVLLAPISGKGDASHDLTKWIYGIREAREAAERKRLFYVACTRAREELHLFAAPETSAKGNFNLAANSLLKAAWPAAQMFFTPTASDVEGPLSLAASAELDEAEAEAGQDDAESPEGIEETGAESIPDLREGPDAESQLALRLASHTAPLMRLPLAFDPAAKFRDEHRLGGGKLPGAVPAAPRFERPEGSLAARALGNAVHAFLEQVTLRLAGDETPAKVTAALRAWTPRITASLRSEGLQPAVVERLAPRVLLALETAVNDPAGLWILSPHAGAETEYALTAGSQQRGTIRIDRIFRAGAEPLDAGSNHLWIVDYKTTNQGAESIDAFLSAEKTKYAPQLEAYAAVLSQAQDESEIRLALYYPLLARLVWWEWLGELPGL